MDDAVALRTLTVQSMPLVVADVPDVGRGVDLRARLLDAGLTPLAGFVGVALPRGARVALHVTGGGLVLLDEDETTLLRAPRDGVDPAWLARARGLRGTMLVVTRSVGPGLADDGSDRAAAESAVVALLHASALDGRAIGAIVGVHEEPRRLPLLV
jgi:hypothetical protein